jgi:hypothetical protein
MGPMTSHEQLYAAYYAPNVDPGKSEEHRRPSFRRWSMSSTRLVRTRSLRRRARDVDGLTTSLEHGHVFAHVAREGQVSVIRCIIESVGRCFS